MPRSLGEEEPLITLRRADERGHFNFGWLDTYHTFSFGEYQDPAHMGFRSLRVINEDRVAPGTGFPTHPHRDMEIVTYVLNGALSHRDSMGNGSTITPGEVQRMSAGTGVTHSEYSHEAEETHLLQIWILPDRKGLAPSYEQRRISGEGRAGELCLVASQDGRQGSVRLHQDAEIHAVKFAGGQKVEHRPREGRGQWVHVVSGRVTVNGVELCAGDGASVEGEALLALEAKAPAEILLFDLA